MVTLTKPLRIKRGRVIIDTKKRKYQLVIDLDPEYEWQKTLFGDNVEYLKKHKGS